MNWQFILGVAIGLVVFFAGCGLLALIHQQGFSEGYKARQREEGNAK